MPRCVQPGLHPAELPRTVICGRSDALPRRCPTLPYLPMNLPAPTARKKLHTRTIVCEGYEREDGLFDIEARIVDTKTYSVDHSRRGLLEPGTPMHDMCLRLTVDQAKTVHDIEVFTQDAPYLECFKVAPAFKRLIGASLVSGWRQAVEQAVGGTQGCTHLKELLGPAATVVFQTTSGGQKTFRQAPGEPVEAVVRPHFLGKCKGWDPSGDAVKELLPSFYVARSGSSDETN